VSYDPVEVLAAFAEKHGITYRLLADAGSVVIRRLALLNEHVYEQHAAFGIPRRDQHWGVAYPGAFLLDEAGVVIDKRFQQSYRERETGAALLEQGFGLPSNAAGADVSASGPVVTASAHLDAATYRLFQRRWLTVSLTIAAGWHVYGEPVPAGCTPLSIRVAPVEGLVVGDVQGPEPRPFLVAGLEEQFVVFEGEPAFALPLTFTQKPGDLTIEATVQYQACSTTDCLPPDALTLTLPLGAENLVDSQR
jgi:hypothetical protein